VHGDSLRILRSALDLQEFTKPELAAMSGASYESVKKVLGQERGRTVDKTGDTVKSPTGRPSDVWHVTDPRGIQARIERSRDGAREIMELANATLREATASESALCNAEDLMAFAMSASEPDDVQDLACRARDEATRALEGTPLERVPDIPTNVPFGKKRNVPLHEGRAQIIHALSDYMVSDEAQGTHGRLWRRAFGCLASFDSPDQAELHKVFMVGLMNLAHQRTQGSDWVP
jgi:hypothetical protein